MKDMKELHYFLGIEAIRTPAGIMISVSDYIFNLLYKFGIVLRKVVNAEARATFCDGEEPACERKQDTLS